MAAKRLITLCVMAIGCAAAAHAQDLRIQFAEPVTLDAMPGSVQFDAYGRRFEVALESNDRLLKALPAVRQAELAGARLMRGRLNGVAGSWVRLARVGDGIEGAIWDGVDLYALTTRARIDANLTTPLAVGPGQTVIYRLSDAVGGLHPNFCALSPARAASHPGTSPLEKYRAMVGELRVQAATAAVALTDQIEISLIGDAAFQALYGANSTDEMLARLNIVDGIFSEQVGILILATDVRLLAAGSDPFTTNEPSDLLSQFADYRRDTPAVRERGLAHLITGRDLANNTNGIAYVGSVCDTRIGVSLSDTSWGTLTAAQVMAHELGHNFGARHDAESGSVCEATAPGFLMSPAVNGSGTFSACSLATMAPVIASARGRCVVAAAYADVRVDASASVTAYDATPFVVPFAVTSAGLIAAQQTTFVATLPAGFAFLSGAVPGGTCSASGANGVTCSLGTLAPAESRTVSLTLTASQIGNATVGASVAAINDFLRGNNSTSASVTIRSGVDVRLTMSSSASTIFVTDPIAFTFEVTANGNRAAHGATLEGSLAGMELDSFSAGPNTCVITLGAAFRCQIIDLAPGAHTSIVVRARGRDSRDWTQTAYVTVPADGDSSNNHASLTTLVLEELGVSTLQSTVDFRTVIGRSYVNTYTLTAIGRLPTTDVRFEVNALRDGTVESVTPSGGTCADIGGVYPSAQFRCSFGTMAPGAVRTVAVRFHMDRGGYDTLAARTIYFNGRQDIPAYQQAGVRSAADMDVAVDMGLPGIVTEGLRALGNIEVRALGINASQNVVVTLDLPASMQLSNIVSLRWTCTRPTAQQGRCTIASLTGDDGPLYINFEFTGATPGPFQAHVTATADGDADAANNAKDLVINVLPYLDAAMATAVERQVAIIGTPKVVNLTITTGARPVTGAQVTATHNTPSWEVASLDVAGTACLPQSFGFRCSLGELPANASIPVTVRYNALIAAHSGGAQVCVTAPGDSKQDNNCVSLSMNTFAPTDLRLTAAQNAVTASSGAQFHLPAISVVNGPEFAADVHVRVPLPAFTTVQSISTSAAFCTGTTTLDCDFQLLRPNETANLDITLTATAAGSFTSNLQLLSANDSTSANNAATISVQVNAASGSSSGGGSGSSSSGGGGGGGGRLEWSGLAFLALLAARRTQGRSAVRRLARVH